MNYDLRKTNKEGRKRFLRYANSLLKNERSNVCLIDESDRTLNQNSYLHVLCRILASYSGVTEDYAKQVYFKRMANPDIFVTATKDPLTNQMITRTRSTTELTITEMRKAINQFRMWAEQNGCSLPDAAVQDDGSVSFNSTQDREAFNQAVMETSREDIWM